MLCEIGFRMYWLIDWLIDWLVEIEMDYEVGYGLQLLLVMGCNCCWLWVAIVVGYGLQFAIVVGYGLYVCTRWCCVQYWYIWLCCMQWFDCKWKKWIVHWICVGEILCVEWKNWMTKNIAIRIYEYVVMNWHAKLVLHLLSVWNWICKKKNELVGTIGRDNWSGQLVGTIGRGRLFRCVAGREWLQYMCNNRYMLIMYSICTYSIVGAISYEEIYVDYVQIVHIV